MMAVAKDVLEFAKRCARGLHGVARRVFQAEVTLIYLDGDARRAERVFGWNRKAVTKGLVEQAFGVELITPPDARGRPRSEDRDARLGQAIDAEMEDHAQADPKFQTAWSYTRATAANVRQETAARWNEDAASMPNERTFRRMLNRRGFRLRRVQKTKPVRKIPQTDAIFANVARSREESRDDPQVLRISLDTKAKVPIGPFSRRGRARGKSAVRAADHDMKPLAKLVPVGILEVESGHLSLHLGTSRETADFLADSLKAWWDARKSQHVQVRKLVIERGIRLTRAAFAAIEERLERAPDLSRWSVRIQPRPPATVLPAA